MVEARLIVSLVLQELLEELVPPRCESDDELEYLAMLFLETERTPGTRITGYFENVVPNISDSTFKKNLQMRRNTFTWLTESLAECRELIPGNIGSRGRAAVPLERQVLLTLELLGNQISFR